MNVVREITTDAPLRPENDERGEHCAYPDGNVVLYGIPDRYCDHRCDPNAWERDRGDRVDLVARRRISAGEAAGPPGNGTSGRLSAHPTLQQGACAAPSAS